jgi:cell wall-associated NlpC family hydrolase
MSVERTAIIAEAREWLGVPFHHQGFSRAGCDCIGLVAGVALALGIAGAEDWRADPRCHQYGRPPNPRFLLETADRFLERIDARAAREADILVMSFERDPMHFALLTATAPPYVIHGLALGGRVVEHRLDERWQGRTRLAYAFRGVA